MKKLILTLFFLTSTMFLSAQTVGQKVGKAIDKTIDGTEKLFKEMHYGVKAKLNVSNVTCISESGITGFYTGLYGRYTLDKDISIQSELLISRQGSKIKTGARKVTISNTYLNIPVLFKYRMGKWFRLETGPQIGFALGKDKLANFGVNKEILKAKTFDFSFAIGLDYNIGRHFDLNNLDLTGRYTIGLTDVYKAKNVRTNKNSVFQVGLAYAF
ncbi:MAG: porin family protein [Flavobacteriales bacterium Tduv]